MPAEPAGHQPPRPLWAANTPAAFWRLLVDPPIPEQTWSAAIRSAASHLPAAARTAGDTIDALLTQTLGEGQFGPDHWRLGLPKRVYYVVKPLMPRPLIERLRRLHRHAVEAGFLEWPIEPRFAQFQWEVARQVLMLTGRSAAPFIHFWPAAHRFAFVLTHDVETADGQSRVRALADLDAEYGFRSSFNFVPERYTVDRTLIEELVGRGFEVGVHGLKHDGRLFASAAEFSRRAPAINRHLRELGACGFRSPLTHRHPEWMQALDIEYDLSFFDTDPYEPIPGGTMTLWPFQIGRFLELPYTLAQDYALVAVLGETTPRLWLEKVDFLRAYFGLALVNTHPDYLTHPHMRQVYIDFLREMRARRDYWQALPGEVARWWRARATTASHTRLEGAVRGTIELTQDSMGVDVKGATSDARASTSPVLTLG
jgi:peptidoglycan/xylan/chitin deacetylase (PgdA/CDA1 family)